MLAHIDDMKAALGIDPAEVNAVRDAQLVTSLELASALIAGYLGIDLSDTETEHPFTTVLADNAGHVTLPAFPILEVRSLTVDGDATALADYYVNNRTGVIEFVYGGYCGCGRLGRRVTVVYRAGYEEIPKDLKMVVMNLASTIFNNGGTLEMATVSGAGALKSLTMFDAMSMSFDTGTSSGSTEEATNTPAGMLKQWAFILNKYRVNSPVMA